MSDRTFVESSAYDIGVLLRAVQLDPHGGFLHRPFLHFFYLVSRQMAALRLQNIQVGGFAGEECEDRSMKT